MKKSKKRTKAKVLHLEGQQSDNTSSSTSEVTRSLFSETWRNYLDEVTMVSIKVKKKGMKEVNSMKREVDRQKAKKTAGLSLIK